MQQPTLEAAAPTSFTLADALGIATASLSVHAVGIVNSALAAAPAQPPPFPAFDYEHHLRVALQLDIDPSRKSGGEGVCKFFLKGFCAKGQACPYRHVSQSQLNANANKAGVVCKHYLRGLCKKGDLCEFLHEYNLKKMPECWFFSKYQSCTNPECQYLHIDPNSKVKECPWYARGFCKHGPKCRNKHVRQSVCQNYVTGFCPKGPECTFGHPKYELPDLTNDGTNTGTGGSGAGGYGGFKKDVMCYKCKQTGHIAVNCPNEAVAAQQPQTTWGGGGPAGGMGPPAFMGGMGRGGGGFQKDLSAVKCFKCQGFGHFANQCPNIPAGGGGGGGGGRFFRPPGGF
ncbi:Cleavage and polyadenylation specificity factor subunit 4 [Podochytrium sp. JEL0797]|nr:Cleavage and polyadenylation specificity factor subunit 4 [Podochytrium sp. JEL0797]